MDVSSEENQIAHLQQQVQQLLKSNAQLTSLIQSLQPKPQSTSPPTSSTNGSASAAAAAQPDPPSPSHHSSHPVPLKVATPDPFTGDLTKTEAFITSLMLYFVGRGEDLTDGQKMTFALSYMKGGTAGQWAMSKVKQLQKEGQTWDEFLDDFKASFCDPDPPATAGHKMVLNLVNQYTK